MQRIIQESTTLTNQELSTLDHAGDSQWAHVGAK